MESIKIREDLQLTDIYEMYGDIMRDYPDETMMR